MTSVTFRRKNKTVEHCFTSMCFFSNTWLRGVTPLDAYTLRQTPPHTETHRLTRQTMSHHPPWSNQLLCRDPLRFEHTLSSSPHQSAYALLTAVLGCLASRFLSQHQLRRHTGVCATHTHTDTHTGSCVYRFGAVTRGSAVYLLLFPLFESITCFFIFFDFD